MTDSSPNTELAPNRGRFAKLCTAPPVSPQPRRRRRRRRRPAPASSPAQAAGSALPLPAARAVSPSRPPFPTRRLPPGPASAAEGLSRAGPPSGTGASRPPRPAPAGAGTHLLVLVGRHGARRGARSARRPPPPFLPAAGPGLGWAGRASLARRGAARRGAATPLSHGEARAASPDGHTSPEGSTGQPLARCYWSPLPVVTTSLSYPLAGSASLVSLPALANWLFRQ